MSYKSISFSDEVTLMLKGNSLYKHTHTHTLS